MRDKSETKPRLPQGLSPSEEAAWWDAHRDYWMARESSDELVESAPIRRTRPVNLRLPVDLIDGLKLVAARRDLPYQTLVRLWLRERLEAETR